MNSASRWTGFPGGSTAPRRYHGLPRIRLRRFALVVDITGQVARRFLDVEREPAVVIAIGQVVRIVAVRRVVEIVGMHAISAAVEESRPPPCPPWRSPRIRQKPMKRWRAGQKSKATSCQVSRLGGMGVCRRLHAEAVGRLRRGACGGGVSGRLLSGLRDGSSAAGTAPVRRSSPFRRVRPGVLLAQRFRWDWNGYLPASDAGLALSGVCAARGYVKLRVLRLLVERIRRDWNQWFVQELVHGSTPNGLFPAILAQPRRQAWLLT